MSVTFTIRHEIAAPRERVFGVMTDLDAMGHWMPNFVGVEKLNDRPFGEGTEFLETRKMFAKKATEHFIVTACEPPSHLELFVDGSKGTTGRGEFRFRYDLEGSQSGTSLTLRAEVTGLGLVMGWISRLFIGSLKKAVAKDLAALKRYVEAEA